MTVAVKLVIFKEVKQTLSSAQHNGNNQQNIMSLQRRIRPELLFTEEKHLRYKNQQ